MNKSYVYFAFVGEHFSPKDIDLRLGIVATEAWQQGSSNGRSLPHRFSYWKLAVTAEKADTDIRLLLQNLVALLNDKIELINSIKAELQADTILKVVLQTNNSSDSAAHTAAMSFDTATINFLHQTGASIDARLLASPSSAA
jgi:hypothetical protein